jgi:hypothetical protein
MVIVVTELWKSQKTGADIAFQDGAGKGDAISKGLKCLNHSVDYVVLTDADYTYPAEYVPEMIDIGAKPARGHGLRKQIWQTDR